MYKKVWLLEKDYELNKALFTDYSNYPAQMYTMSLVTF